MAIGSEDRRTAAALETLAQAARGVAEAATLREAAAAIVAAVGRAAGADVVVGRVADDLGERLVTCGVYAVSPALAAEFEGSRVAVEELPEEEVDEAQNLPAAVRRAAERGRLADALFVPVRLAGTPVASLELLRIAGGFDENERQLARLGAHQLAAAARSFDGRALPSARDGLALAGEALAASSDASRTPEHLVRLAAEATGATTALLWRITEGAPELAAAYGADQTSPALGTAAEAAARALGQPLSPTREEGDFPGGASTSVTLQLGQPVIGALQLLFPTGGEPPGSELPRLATFGVRAAHALRASTQARTLALELERTRTLLTVVAQATAELSLQHTLKTALEHTAELVGTEHVAVYLRYGGRLHPSGRELTGPHVAVAEHLLELLLGPFRARKVLVVEDVPADAHLAPVAGAAAEAGIEAAIAVPLLVQDEVIGLLAVYPPRGRRLTDSESELLTALAVQLAIAVQNARLHEDAKQREDDLNAQKDELQRKTDQLRGLYITQSFTESLSLDRTLETVARMVVEILRVDAAVMRMPDERGDALVPCALHVSDERFADAAQTIFYRPQPLRGRLQRLFADRQPFLLNSQTADLGGDSTLLGPFLDRGWTGAVVPIHTPTEEVVAVLTIYSLHPDAPVDEEMLAGAVAIATQAALAIDNARLYQQQKAFADTMQRSLLPRTSPQVPGLELGAAYAASAKVDVGGDLYDFLVLADGRLAVVLGDVTGHGVDATADMAMAKFVFRSLAREHPEPGQFLAAANDVVLGEIAAGKFITMLYLVVSGEGAVTCAGAGHPPPRLVGAGGVVRSLDARGLVLGVSEGQRYEEVHETLEPGGFVVLYTDGVLEARNGGDFYGVERLDSLLSRERNLPAHGLAAAVLADCRRFAGGELADDGAVVVVRRT